MINDEMKNYSAKARKKQRGLKEKQAVTPVQRKNANISQP
jgi:hypothetical protein